MNKITILLRFSLMMSPLMSEAHFSDDGLDDVDFSATRERSQSSLLQVVQLREDQINAQPFDNAQAVRKGQSFGQRNSETIYVNIGRNFETLIGMIIIMNEIPMVIENPVMGTVVKDPLQSAK